ncbi:cbb3-type cytochrome oxidase assembly protein CcoS [Paracoccus marinaquae]|uniref:Cbb3-type cytochrome oxidase assembly protein CcoS n=1 Tax=Paracoccus marinaquae TaxID=2841926 RepID=A0ABS6AK48_9RHOB|nr:cbb3-type cytochrome oxidase assembly protein CcoS [Paracoccus marinaquae]MBU3030596.1 cbb3-type cytochrome oxidase assembly protein CcoS [Paracoccus marinaquae]
MSLAVLIPVSIALGLVGLAAFFWALRGGQFDDPDGAAWRVITPQDPPKEEGNGHVRLASDTHHPDARSGL